MRVFDRETARWARARRTAIASALLVAGMGCGGDDPLSRASGTAMDAAPLAKPGRSDRAGNSTPRINAVYLEPDSPGRGETVRAVVDAEDPDGDSVTLRYRWEIGGQQAAFKGAEASLAWAKKGDVVNVTVTANDGRNESDPYLAQTEVANQAPLLRNPALDPDAAGIVAGSEMGVSVDLADPDGDEVTMTASWYVNGSFRAEGDRFSTAGLTRGDRVSVTVEATDGEDESEPWESEELEVLNAPPIIVSQPEAPGPDGVFRYQVRAEDADRDQLLSYSLASAPDGMTIQEHAGAVEWTPRREQAGTHVIEIVVTDRHGDYSSQRFTLEVGEGETAPPASAN